MRNGSFELNGSLPPGSARYYTAGSVDSWSILAGAPNLVCGGSHSGNIAAADLARRDLLDIISSDYVPASLLHGAYLLHARLAIPLPDAIATVTATPAERASLDGRGRIEAGYRADLVRVRLITELPVIRGVWRGDQQVA